MTSTDDYLPSTDDSMTSTDFSMRTFMLRFENAELEARYRDIVLERTLVYSRTSWGILIALLVAFAFLDAMVFPDHLALVRAARVALGLVCAGVLSVSFSPRHRRLMVYSSPMFILSLGAFCVLLIGVSDPENSTPYFASLFFAFTGVLTTAGIGFRQSLTALLAIVVSFELVIGALLPVDLELFIVYSAFMPAIVAVFAYIGYFIERMSRENYIALSRLSESMAQVKQLSGLLPICWECKNVRDDSGYWRQIEVYIANHTEAVFSHGICPPCMEKLYPEYLPDEDIRGAQSG